MEALRPWKKRASINHSAKRTAVIESLVQGLEGVVADLEGSIEAMRDDGGGGVDGLRAEIWGMEGEMRAAAEG